jgi:hypothetical protein
MSDPVVGIALADGPIALNGCCAVRVTRNLTDGTPDAGNAKGSVMLCGGIQRFVYDFDTQAGKATLDEDACGTIIVNRRRDDQTLRATFTLTLLRSSWRFDDVVGAKKLLVSGGSIMGAATEAASGCKRISKPKFTMEVWSERVDCNDLATPPYRIDLFGNCRITPKGHTKEDATAGVTYEGFCDVNRNFQDGPFGDYPTLIGEQDWVHAEFDTDAIPDCPDPEDYIPTPAAS